MMAALFDNKTLGLPNFYALLYIIVLNTAAYIFFVVILLFFSKLEDSYIKDAGTIFQLYSYIVDNLYSRGLLPGCFLKKRLK